MKKLFTVIISSLLFSFLFAESPSLEDAALTFFKKLNETQTRLTYMNKKSSLAKVGTETVNGLVSGTCFYDVKIKGAGAIVTLRYTNYCDEAGWIFDGEIITNSNMAQNGTFTGTVKMKTPESSITPSLEVCYDNVKLVKGEPGSGYYLVTLPDSNPAKVDYSTYQKSKK
jgi:hypothetical protein